MCSFNYFCGLFLSVLRMTPSFFTLRLCLTLTCPCDCEGGVDKENRRTEEVMACGEGID